MVFCFVPDCNHNSAKHACSFFRFPKLRKEKHRWVKLIRRADRTPSSSSRVCSCHFRNGKESGPEVFSRNIGKLFPLEPLKTCSPIVNTSPTKENKDTSACRSCKQLSVEKVILEVQLSEATNKINEYEVKENYSRERYTLMSLSEKVLCMESGLPDKNIFYILVSYIESFKTSINYFAGWKVKVLSLEDQVLVTLMKLRQNYTNLHLAQLFHCSTSTIRNIVLTFLHVLHRLIYEDCMRDVPSREKNQTSLPESFRLFRSCRMIVDCTDIEIAAPALLSDKKMTYSVYRGMHSFKLLLGVAPNGVVTYVSSLFPGSVSDKAIVEKSKLLDIFQPGDLILADKGFLIQDIVPKGVSVNIPPFLNHGKFSESEVKITKNIAKCRIHVERANARLKDFKILSFIPPYLRGYADKVVKVCTGLVNMQHPLIKEITENDGLVYN